MEVFLKVLVYLSGEFLGLIHADYHVGGLRTHIFEDDKVIEFELFDVVDFPDKQLMFEDDGGGRVAHGIDFYGLLIEPGYLQASG